MFRTTAEFVADARQGLAADPPTAVRCIVFTDEAWYGDFITPVGGPALSWSVSVDDPNGDGGTFGEATITWHDLSATSGALAWRLDVFGDGLQVLIDAGLTDVLTAHPDVSPAQLRTALSDAGWVDRTERINPWPPTTPAVCASCGAPKKGTP